MAPTNHLPSIQNKRPRFSFLVGVSHCQHGTHKPCVYTRTCARLDYLCGFEKKGASCTASHRAAPRCTPATPRSTLPPYLEVRREGVGKAHAAGERRQDEVAQLDARRRDHVAEAQVVVAQEFGEVVQEHQQRAEHALVEEAHRLQQRGPAFASGNERVGSALVGGCMRRACCQDSTAVQKHVMEMGGEVSNRLDQIDLDKKTFRGAFTTS